ncbi:MAG: sodium:solute symporter family protein [Candidatus Woesearchaeota archaeon]
MNVTLVVLGAYLVLMLGLAFYYSRKETITGYFLNNRKTGPWLMTLSSFSTIVGAGAVVAVATETYRSGISFGIALPISFIVGAILLAIVAKPIREIGQKYGAYSIVDFFEKRFDRKNKILMLVIQMLALIAWITTQVLAISALATLTLGVSYGVALLITAGITIIYTAIGGLRIDIITDFVQSWIIMIVFVATSIFAYLKLGSIGHLINALPPGHLDPFAYGGIAWSVGIIFVGGLIYIINTSHWQRIFSATTSKVARRSFIYLIPIIGIFGLIVLFVSLAAVVLIPGIDPSQAAFAIMDHVLPSAFVGVGYAALLAVAMSSVDSLLVGGSTIIYREIRSKKKKNAVLLARGLTAAFGVASFLLALVMKDIVVAAILTGSIAVVLAVPIIRTVLSKKFSANASFWTMLVSLAILLATYPFFPKFAFLPAGIISAIMAFSYDPLSRYFSRKQAAN